MSKARFFYGNNSKKYTLTATNEASTFPVTNVLSPSAKNTWRSTDNGVRYITFYIANALNVRFVYIENYNITGGTFKLQTSDNGSSWTDHAINAVSETRREIDGDGEFYSTTYRKGYVTFTDLQSFKYYRLYMDYSSVTYYEIGFIGLYTGDYEFPVNYIRNFRGGLRTNKDIYDTKTGNTFSSFNFIRREYEFDFNMIGSTQNNFIVGALPMYKNVVFAKDGLTTLYLVEAFVDDLSINIDTDNTGYKSCSVKLIELI